MNLPFGLSLSKPSHHGVGEPFDRLRANGEGWLLEKKAVGWIQVVAATAFLRATASAALVVPVAGSLSAPR
jgi:hypothetical protein